MDVAPCVLVLVKVEELASVLPLQLVALVLVLCRLAAKRAPHLDHVDLNALPPRLLNRPLELHLFLLELGLERRRRRRHRGAWGGLRDGGFLLLPLSCEDWLVGEVDVKADHIPRDEGAGVLLWPPHVDNVASAATYSVSEPVVANGRLDEGAAPRPTESAVPLRLEELLGHPYLGVVLPDGCLAVPRALGHAVRGADDAVALVAAGAHVVVCKPQLWCPVPWRKHHPPGVRHHRRETPLRDVEGLLVHSVHVPLLPLGRAAALRCLGLGPLGLAAALVLLLAKVVGVPLFVLQGGLLPLGDDGLAGVHAKDHGAGDDLLLDVLFGELPQSILHHLAVCAVLHAHAPPGESRVVFEDAGNVLSLVLAATDEEAADALEKLNEGRGLRGAGYHLVDV
mmetsp:Transcript_61149/g.147160  ORF Transcript_61149/g.147160 Transcript_61149/m.147160 type:complete len:396 (-) Transcript_61149:57-1244(-)